MRRATFAVAVAVAAAAALIALPSRAFVRSTGDNGRCLWWRQPTGIPVVAHLNDGPTGAGCAGQEQVSSLIRDSLATWGASARQGQPCSSVRFDYLGPTAVKATGFDQAAGAPNENLIVFRHGVCSGNPACGADLEACADQIGCWPHDTGSRTIAITTTSYRPDTGEIVDADMELHDHSVAEVGFFFTCASAGAYCGRGVEPTGSCVSTDAGSILTHEAGHMLGLDHPPDKPDATMFATYTPGSLDLRDLDVDDVNGICTVYPAGGSPRTTCSGGSSTVPPPPNPPRNSSDGGGCSTATAGVLSMLGVAVALGSRRRRRQDTITPA